MKKEICHPEAIRPAWSRRGGNLCVNFTLEFHSDAHSALSNSLI